MVRIQKQDPFVDKFFEQIAPQIAESFTIDQLAAIKMVFGVRAWARHGIDVRFSFPFLWRRYFIVLILGKDRRSAARRALERKDYPLATFANGLVTVMFVLILCIPLILIFYAFDAAFGINAGGGHSFVADFVDQIRQIFR